MSNVFVGLYLHPVFSNLFVIRDEYTIYTIKPYQQQGKGRLVPTGLCSIDVTAAECGTATGSIGDVGAEFAATAVWRDDAAATATIETTGGNTSRIRNGNQ